jgi:hypothetical protein
VQLPLPIVAVFGIKVIRTATKADFVFVQARTEGQAAVLDFGEEIEDFFL